MNVWPIWHGVLVGIVVAATPLAVRPRVEIELIVPFAVTLLAGAVGGWLGSQIKRDSESVDTEHAGLDR